MKQIKIMVLSKQKIKKYVVVIMSSILGIYLLISLYFINHFYFQTEINGMNVSLKSHEQVTTIIHQYMKGYELQLLERDGDTEVITGRDIGMQYNKNITSSQIHQTCKRNPFLWIASLFKRCDYDIKDLYSYNKFLLDNRINNLACLNEEITEPKNVSFQYLDGTYITIKEKYGNKINKDKLIKTIHRYLSEGRTVLDLDKLCCYENPKFTHRSKKTDQTKDLLNKYIETKITYQFGRETEYLDGTTIHRWLRVDENLDVIINEQAVSNYINKLIFQYDTVGKPREFKSSTGKKVELKGGLYGWKIDYEAETKALYHHIKNADVINKEPLYSQRAISREGNEIGDTYIEINITKQYLWFYKAGKLIVQGSIVTGNPYKGNPTVLGVYMINYKQRNTTLTGPNYEAKVNYWMPFFGNQGLHDATWRYRFGGEIYKRNGSHGCVNLPLSLAKAIYENVEEGTPVILYEESM
ncbi:L,D-transpeptidase/peptidoglycan binding protein [Mobilitalea sibirica]|uniref:L,D-transpeptidase/peptidoglycan binding protein n=1 Tax=Mobilitalea sibirica TaxID=1462919 RepID=A0A8J7H005_9FIRM|nr:L,D-transpeptidase family protein [Mobilitalea sibirica]MBH1941604.1 L,D-transpeptidase/peptidoglycan binding protein [Mobilitalea sibirica]